MKRFAVLMFAAVLLGLVGPGLAYVQERTFDGSEHIRSIDTTIAIRADGTIDVNEGILYDFDGLERHGIYRDMPFVKTNETGKKYAIDISGVTVRDENGAPYRFTRTTEGDMVRFRIGDPDKTVTGPHMYLIGYKASGALTYFPGHDELYWNAVGTSWDVPVAKTSVEITLPGDVETRDLNLACFTGPIGSTAKDCTAKQTGPRTARIESASPLDSGEGLTVVVGFPKNMVAVLEARELVPFFDTFWGKVVLVFLGIVGFLWYIVAPVVVVRKWFTSGRDPKPAMGEVAAWFSPPKTAYKRDLTPAETGTLVDERADLRDIYASIVDLARRGYLTIIETKKNTFDLRKNPDGADERDMQPFERELIKGIFVKSDLVSVKTLDISRTLERVKSMLYESLVSDRFFPTNPNTLRGWYIALAVFAFITLNPILFLVSLIFGQGMPRKTLFGAEQAAVARSLKNFLSSQDKQLAFQAKKQMMFEKLLPFAVAFGVEEIWARRFADLGLKQPDWYVSSGGGQFNSVAFAHSMGHGMNTSFAASIAAHSSSGHSSGFSGGSSGGGGGGGGGGSW